MSIKKILLLISAATLLASSGSYAGSYNSRTWSIEGHLGDVITDNTNTGGNYIAIRYELIPTKYWHGEDTTGCGTATLRHFVVRTAPGDSDGDKLREAAYRDLLLLAKASKMLIEAHIERTDCLLVDMRLK